jgi:hypothetical protein
MPLFIARLGPKNLPAVTPQPRADIAGLSLGASERCAGCLGTHFSRGTSVFVAHVTIEDHRSWHDGNAATTGLMADVGLLEGAHHAICSSQAEGTTAGQTDSVNSLHRVARRDRLELPTPRGHTTSNMTTDGASRERDDAAAGQSFSIVAMPYPDARQISEICHCHLIFLRTAPQSSRSSADRKSAATAT